METRNFCSVKEALDVLLSVYLFYVYYQIWFRWGAKFRDTSLAGAGLITSHNLVVSDVSGCLEEQTLVCV